MGKQREKPPSPLHSCPLLHYLITLPGTPNGLATDGHYFSLFSPAALLALEGATAGMQWQSPSASVGHGIFFGWEHSLRCKQRGHQDSKTSSKCANSRRHHIERKGSQVLNSAGGRKGKVPNPPGGGSQPPITGGHNCGIILIVQSVLQVPSK